jgi:hypothetical protein
LARETGSGAIAALSGEVLLGERAVLNGYVIPGLTSPGGACRLLRASDDWIALNLARPDDRELLPALFGDAALDPWDEDEIAARVARSDSAMLLAQGRALGLAIAALQEPNPPQPVPALAGREVAVQRTEGSHLAARWDPSVSPAGCHLPVPGRIEMLAHGPQRELPARAPRVLDLSALWAGPLAGHLLWLAGAEVVKVENPRRPDAMRHGDPALFATFNQGKASVAIDFTETSGRAALLSLIAHADIVIEAARPRALAQLGIDAQALVAAQPGLVWLTITGHGARAPQAEWVGFGDDAAVAGGLTAAMFQASGTIGFGGDAPADPLTGIMAAVAGWRAWRGGTAQRIGLSLSGVVATALAEERTADPAALHATLRAWSRRRGMPFPAHPARPVTQVRPFGADTAAWLAC